MIAQQMIAHYRINAKLGEGGMGEVWRATDTKLNREVAIKILPDAFAKDPDRMARFEREAKVLAALNHPNIAQIYGVEERALVMELVEGETLKGPLPLETALDYAWQIGDALEAAHGKGIVHRDLKPANIKITPAGKVKVLDFGLAKAAEERSGDVQNSPTLTMSPTRSGVILGTAPYMSPEQARGKSVDKRADIWSFGCVLFEMLTGKPAFRGETTTDILAAVVTKEPDLEKVPVKVRRLVEACLRKDPKERLQTISDWRLLLENVEAPTVKVNQGKWPWFVAAILAISTAVGLGGWWRASRPIDHPLTRLSVDLGPDALTGLNTTVAISPDGRRLVYPERGPDGKQQLATRLLDQAVMTLLPGTESGFDAFFSPDGQWIGFFANGLLKKISVQGGAPVTLCAAPLPFGASWGNDGNIVAALNFLGPLAVVPASGGSPKPLTKLAGESSQRWPQVLPGGQAVIFTASPSTTAQDNAIIKAYSLRTGQTKILERGGYFGRYLPSGHLLYVHRGVLLGVGFDQAKLEPRGIPTPIAEDLAANPTSGGGHFAVSATGTFVYASGKGSSQTWRVAWLDSSGKIQPIIGAPGQYFMPHFSSDGGKLAFTNGSDTFVYDLQRDTTIRLTFSGSAVVPVWAPDGKHLVYRDLSAGSNGSILVWIRSDGGGEPQRLLESATGATAWSMSPDGLKLAYFEQSPETANDIWILPLDLSDADHPKPGKPELFLRTPADEHTPVFSPDGRWIAYGSNESGTNVIYVRPYPALNGARWQISTGGDQYPFWSKNGHELFYQTEDHRLMVADYTVDGDSFVPGKPRPWYDKPLFDPGALNLDLAPDGKHFAVLTMPEASDGEKGSVHATFLLNFFDELRRRVPVSGK